MEVWSKFLKRIRNTLLLSPFRFDVILKMSFNNICPLFSPTCHNSSKSTGTVYAHTSCFNANTITLCTTFILISIPSEKLCLSLFSLLPSPYISMLLLPVHTLLLFFLQRHKTKWRGRRHISLRVYRSSFPLFLCSPASLKYNNNNNRNDNRLKLRQTLERRKRWHSVLLLLLKKKRKKKEKTIGAVSSEKIENRYERRLFPSIDQYIFGTKYYAFMLMCSYLATYPHCHLLPFIFYPLLPVINLDAHLDKSWRRTGTGTYGYICIHTAARYFMYA